MSGETTETIPEGLLFFNGIDGRTGQYLIPPMTAEKLVRTIVGGKARARRDRRAVDWKEYSEQPDYAPMAMLDPKKLDSMGWGVIFPARLDPAALASLREAMGELLEHRKAQAGPFYREYTGADGYRPGDNAQKWLARHNSGFGRVDPREGAPPYYLLVAGDPNSIPFEFQYNLDVDRAVGRLHFDTLDEYASYARSVVWAETGKIARSRRAVFFGVSNPDDRATYRSAQQLVVPLAERIQANQQSGSDAEKALLGPWEFETLLGEDADRVRLLRLLGGDATPALLFTASHGVGFRPGDPEQLDCQGALVCQDWPGPFGGGIRRDHYVAAEDIAAAASPFGLISFHFACFGAGTPFTDEFYAHDDEARAPIAPYAFIAKLPRRLLAHPKGGALAMIGHVERAWTHSFVWKTSKEQTSDFYEVLCQLMGDYPIGYAMEALNTRYASISAQLSQELQQHQYSPRPPEMLADLWTGNNDARGYAIVGDPAVKLAVAKEGAPVEAAAIEVVSHRTGTLPMPLDPAADPRNLAVAARR